MLDKLEIYITVIILSWKYLFYLSHLSVKKIRLWILKSVPTMFGPCCSWAISCSFWPAFWGIACSFWVSSCGWGVVLDGLGIAASGAIWVALTVDGLSSVYSHFRHQCRNLRCVAREVKSSYICQVLFYYLLEIVLDNFMQVKCLLIYHL